MKHKASLWTGVVGIGHITDVHCESDTTHQELIDMADQVSTCWQTIELELDPAHPCFGRTYRIERSWPSPDDEEDALLLLKADDEIEGKFVWVHCCQNVLDPKGGLENEMGRSYRQVFNTAMLCMEFTLFDEIVLQCDENFGEDGWDAYELYFDDDLPEPVASYG